jgi:2-polyprenyl-6-methoxyphenol hydroxylase-like FAD-dependent oxidoreductase
MRRSTEQHEPAVPVLIVCAGPTGLVLALWLTKLGVSVRIIDKTAEPGRLRSDLSRWLRRRAFHRSRDARLGLSRWHVLWTVLRR